MPLRRPSNLRAVAISTGDPHHDRAALDETLGSAPNEDPDVPTNSFLLREGLAADVWLYNVTKASTILVNVNHDGLPNIVPVVKKTMRVTRDYFQNCEDSRDEDLLLNLRKNFQDRFQSLWASLAVDHPNLATLYSVVPKDLTLFQEYCENGDLREYLKKDLLEVDYIRIIADVLRGIAHLHNHNPPIPHGHINPGKIYIKGDAAVLGEFGLSQLVSDFPHLVPSISVTGLTRWMSPEYFSEPQLGVFTTQGDMWSFGSRIKIFTGSLPFHWCKYDIQALVKITAGVLPGDPESVTYKGLSRAPAQVMQRFITECWLPFGNRPSAQGLSEQVSQILPRFTRESGTDWNPVTTSPRIYAEMSSADALKFGPLQSIVAVLQEFADTYQLEGIVRSEYEALQQPLRTLLKILEDHSDGGISPSMTSRIESLHDFIETELSSIAENQSGERYGRLPMAKDDEERFIGSCRRIQEYMERLLLDTSLSTWKLGEHQLEYRMTYLINRLPSSPSAWYNSSTGEVLMRRECTAGTRVKVLANVLGWAASNKIGVYWLNGMPGTGKTTIAYNVCKELDNNRNLAASFFCSRLREECRNVKMIIPSIAYQLARFSPSFRSALSGILEKDPDAHHGTLDKQVEKLIKMPLSDMLTYDLPILEPLVVVIDALDECENKENTSIILDRLLTKTARLPIKFLVSSRPEPHIRDQMSDGRTKFRLVLQELDKGEVQADIEMYLREGLAPMNPSDAQIAALVERAGILFVYAATAVRYIGDDRFRSNPEGRLREVLDASGDDMIGELYTTILEAAFGNRKLRLAQQDVMRQVLYTIICAREPLTVESLSRLLGIEDAERVRATLRPLWSVLYVMEENELVTALHTSFPDFMFDSTRSKTYWCDSNAYHRKLAEHCFEYIAQIHPQFNICGLESSYLPDEAVPDIQERVAESISSELLYACRYWADHVKAANCAPDVIEHIRDFLSIRLLLWVEVLNLTNQMKTGIESVKLVVEWCKTFEGAQELAELARDARRFVEAFTANPVSQSTPHIYVSMLVFWPRSAPISKHYAKFTRGPVEPEGTALDRRQLAHLSTWAFEKSIKAVAVSPDGLHIALAVDNQVLLVDSSRGRVVLGPLQGHPNEVISVSFTPDGSCILAGSFDTMYAAILGWNTLTGDLVLGPLQLHGHTDNISCLGFSPDSLCIATGSHDKTVRLWSVETGRLLQRLEAHDQVYPVVFSPDGTQVAAGAGNTLHRWDSRTGEPTHTPLPHSHNINVIAFSPDQSCITSGNWGSSAIWVWDALSGNLIRSIEGHTNYLTCIGYSPDGRTIVSGSGDRTIRVWDVQSGDMVLGPFKAHTSSVSSVTFSPDGSHIISACWGGFVCTWDAQQHSPTLKSTTIPSHRVTCVKFSSDGARFVSGSVDGMISIWDADTGEMASGPVKVHTSRINAVDFKNGLVVSGSSDGKICVCDARSGEVVPGPFEVGSKAIKSIAYSPDGNLIATGSSAGVDVCNAQDGSRILGPLTDLVGDVSSVQFSPDGTHIAASSRGFSSNIVVWDVSDGQNVFCTLDGHRDWVCSVSYSPNGALIASGSGDHTIIIWDAYTGEKAIGPLTGHSDYVLSVSFSPDGTRLVSGSSDRTIIWNMQTGEMVFELPHGNDDRIMSVEYSPDGTRILSHSDDMSVRIHDAQSPEERAQSRPRSEVGNWTMDKDGWVVDDQSRLLVWVPGDLRSAVMRPETHVMIAPQGYVRLKFDKSRMGESWAQSYISHE